MNYKWTLKKWTFFRYYALLDPIEHARRRTGRFVLGTIFIVWTVSCVICLPPLIGWNDWPEHFTPDTPCKLTEEPGYVVYSSMGSFYIPLAIIIFVYIKIFHNMRTRLRKRAAASNLSALKQQGGNNNMNGQSRNNSARSQTAVAVGNDSSGEVEETKKKKHILAKVST